MIARAFDCQNNRLDGSIERLYFFFF